jgi:LysM repeat protein
LYLGAVLSLLSLSSGRFADLKPTSEDPVWGTKPLASYFFLTGGLSAELHREVRFDEPKWQALQAIGREEYYQLQSLEIQSTKIVNRPLWPLWLKRLAIRMLGYNQQVDSITEETDRALQTVLSPLEYQRLVEWIENRWLTERQIHGEVNETILSSSRSYQVYATRYDSGGAYKVALPDKCVKFTNGGNSICSGDGYVVGQKYSVFISYKKGVGVIVGESGPWNVDDNYWSGWNDPTPRRMFADLPVGMPEAQAAYFNGYNGGADQFGRKVTGPYGIDLARQVSIDIGLQPGVNDWIAVSFLWTEGWDSGIVQASRIPGTPGAIPATELAIVPVQVATPMSDGAVIHTVEPGQTLWEIAVAYQIGLQTLYQQNNLVEGAIIRPGDKLVIHPAGSVTPNRTQDSIATESPVPTSRSTHTPRASPTAKAIAELKEPVNPIEGNPDQAISPVRKQTVSTGLVTGAAILVGVGILLVGLGKILARR